MTEISCKVCDKKFMADSYYVKIGRKKYCSVACRNKAHSMRLKGTFPPWLNTPESIANMRKAKTGKIYVTNPKRSERKAAMGRAKYKNWRTKVFERDNYTCTWCGIRGVKLHADHIVPWSKAEELRYDLSNGRTLCVACHETTDSFPKQFRSTKVEC